MAFQTGLVNFSILDLPDRPASRHDRGMFDAMQILGFLGAVVVLVIVPGPNTMLILAQSAAGGRSAGLATVLGVETGTQIHVLAAASGLSAVLASSPTAFDAVRLVGAAYLTVLGLRALLAAGGDALQRSASGRVSLPQAYRRAVLTNILNPKTAVFVLALLPQFARPERGHVGLQFAVLGLMLSAVSFTFGCFLAVAAGSVGGWISRPGAVSWQQRLLGGVLLGLGVRLAFAQR
jgi:threonine/homoserine/homoserine lactone efflux protein